MGEHVFTHNGAGAVTHLLDDVYPLCGFGSGSDRYTVFVNRVTCGDCLAAAEGTFTVSYTLVESPEV